MHEPTFLILAALAAGPLHGYGVLRAVEEISGGRVELRAGTLYAALDRLGTEGLAEVSGEDVVAGRHRRYYAITGVGRRRLSEEAARLEANAAVARRRLAVRPA